MKRIKDPEWMVLSDPNDNFLSSASLLEVYKGVS